MNINTIIFDMDGVIFDTEKLYLEIWKEIFQEYGYSLKDEDYFFVMGRGRKKVKEMYLTMFGEKLPVEEMYREKDRRLNNYIDIGRANIKEGTIELLKYLKDKGYNIALATSAKKERVNKHINREELQEFFGYIVTGDSIIKPKPDAEIFLKVAGFFKVNPVNCLVIEDSKSGIIGAMDGGMNVIHIPDLIKNDKEILSLNPTILENLKEVIEYLEKYNNKLN